MPVPAAISSTRLGADAATRWAISSAKSAKEYGAEPVIVKRRNAAGEVGGSIPHDTPLAVAIPLHHHLAKNAPVEAVRELAVGVGRTRGSGFMPRREPISVS
jgi:hypothetical protein